MYKKKTDKDLKIAYFKIFRKTLKDVEIWNRGPNYFKAN